MSERVNAEADRQLWALLDELGPDRTPLGSLRALRELRARADSAEAVAMYQARKAGLRWALIGQALGMTGQAASKRLRDRHQLPDPRTDRSRGPYRRRSRKAADELDEKVNG